MFIGRKYELDLIRSQLADNKKAQLIILYGRRRVGKSTLIRESVKQERRVLFFEGIEGGRRQDQIDQFLNDLSLQTGRVKLSASNWRDVFRGVGELVEKGRWVLVFDEFPWMGSGRTQIVSELKLYWDRWSKNPNVALFLCGSVASFMLQHVVHSKALHNRKTLEICLKPLSPKETGAFIPRRSVVEKAGLYMTLGGIPKYLEQIDANRSLHNNLNRLAFSSNGFFIEEFETLFKEQFKSTRVYSSIVEALAKSPANVTMLSKKIGVAKGGGFKKQLDNLVRAQFVREYTPVSPSRRARSRTKMYKLIDPFLIFYFRYVHPNRDIIARNSRGEDLFKGIAGSTIQQYYGYAFERLCEDAMDNILDRLDIQLSDIEAMGPYFQQKRSNEGGLQIDWLIIRRFNVWNLIEFKYTNAKIGTSVIKEMQQKVSRLNAPPDITVEPVLVSASGVVQAVENQEYFNKVLTLTDLL